VKYITRQPLIDVLIIIGTSISGWRVIWSGYARLTVKYKNFSDQREKPKGARPLREVSIAKVILQTQDISRGKSPTISYSFLLHSIRIPDFHSQFEFSNSSRSSPVTASLVVIDSNTYTTVSFTDFHFNM